MRISAAITLVCAFAATVSAMSAYHHVGPSYYAVSPPHHYYGHSYPATAKVHKVITSIQEEAETEVHSPIHSVVKPAVSYAPKTTLTRNAPKIVPNYPNAVEDKPDNLLEGVAKFLGLAPKNDNKKEKEEDVGLLSGLRNFIGIAGFYI
jgi:hypothetical protein